jgi:hypothetical protein
LKITDMFCYHSSQPSDDLRTSMLFNLTFEETGMADTLAKDDIDCRNLRYSRSRPRPGAVSAAEEDMMDVVVVVVVNIVEQFEIWRCKRAEF